MIEAARKTILIAEDDKPIRKMLTVMLSRAGYELLVANDGEAGWKIIQQHKGRIDLLLSDVIMPRMTGVELAERASRSRPDINILLVSAYDRELLVHDRGWAFLPKPFSAKALVEKVAEVLAEPTV